MLQSQGLLSPEIKQAARLDLSVYSQCLGYENADFHDRWYEMLQPQNDPEHFSPLRCHDKALKKYHEEAPRKHAKSECIAINYPSWLIGNFPELMHILVISESGTLAYQTAAAIRRRIEGHGEQGRRHVEIFGDMKPAKGIKWTDAEFTVKRNVESKFPTLRATGVLGSITGGGFNLIIADDIISAKSVLTRNQILKTQQWFFEVIQTTMFPWGAIFVIGTRWHYDDLYSTLMTPKAEGGKGWEFEVLKAILNEREIAQGKKPRVLWPAYWSYKRLMEKKDELGSIWFNCQYQNDPTSLEGDLLKSKWLNEYEHLPDNLYPYAAVDPALGEGDKQAISDYSFDPRRKQAYLTDVWCDAVDFDVFLKHLQNLHAKRQYLKIFVEANSFQKVLFYLPELKHLPMVPVTTVSNKEMRFIPMAAHFEAKRILVDPLLKSPTHEFYRQWVEFPRGKNDDALDAVELPIQFLLSAGSVDGFVVG